MGWHRSHVHKWSWAQVGDAIVSIVFEDAVFGWQICRCGEWRVRRVVYNYEEKS